MTGKYAGFGAVIALVALCMPLAAHAQKLVFVVRHAECADAGRSTPVRRGRGAGRKTGGDAWGCRH